MGVSPVDHQRENSNLGMNDPHVESLTYELETDDTVSFNAPPVEHETDTFSLRLEDGTLHVDLKEHFASIEEACSEVERFLQSWEVRDGIRRGKPEISFGFEDSEVVDRDPPDGNQGKVKVVNEEVHITAEGSPSVRETITRGKYPQPPDHFRLSPNARSLWQRYQQYEDGREPLFGMAFGCLRMLEGWAGGRKRAGRRYQISNRVLDKLGYLSSKRGTEEVARKPDETERGATAEEKKWLEETVRKIVHQVGIRGAGHEPTKLTLDDLPGLS